MEDDILKQAVDKEKEKMRVQHDKTLLAALLKERAATEIIIDKMISAIKVLPDLEIQPIALTQLDKTPVSLLLQLSDIQAGTYIRKDTTGGLGEYNLEIMKKQFKLLLDRLARAADYQSRLAPITELCVHALGDLVEGIDIYVGQAQHVDQDLYDQLFELADLICWLLLELLHIFPKIRFVGIGGNHGRIGKKGENPHWVNWDVYLYKYIQAKLQRQKRLDFVIPKSWWYVDQVQGRQFLMLHGDDIKAWNGIPYYGISRADARWTQLLASKNIYYEYMELGHFHSPTELPRIYGELIVNGCWPGGSLFSLKSLVTSGRPRQNLMAIHPQEGRIWSSPIWLDTY